MPCPPHNGLSVTARLFANSATAGLDALFGRWQRLQSCPRSNRRRRAFRLERLEPRELLTADPLISEFAAANDNVLLDSDGDSSDWIEIHNPADVSLNLENFYLTDDADDLTKWRFPATLIDPDGYLTVFASDKDRSDDVSQLHTNFKLTTEGEFLALVEPDGLTIVSQFGDSFPRQFAGISYGTVQPEDVTPLVSADTPASLLVPDADDDAAIGQSWTGGELAFDDSQWTEVTGGVGFNLDVDPQFGIEGEIAYVVPTGTTGNQAFGGSLGMDFVVAREVTVTSLGVFDDRSDGLRRNLTVQLWSRDDGGTSDDFSDDQGVEILASTTFSQFNSGLLLGGSRFRLLDQPLVLSPGTYTISAFGFGATDRNAIAPDDGSIGSLAGSGAVSFVGSSRFGGGGSTGFPDTVDLGSASRYGAGTFTFVDPLAREAEISGRTDVVAYSTLPGEGNAASQAALGMDFDVVRPIRVTELGVFDSGQDGIAGTLGVSLWSRNSSGTRVSGELLVSRMFIGDDGTIEPGTGSRFLPLDEPLFLQPGRYSIVASGFGEGDPFSREDYDSPTSGTTHSAGGAIQFTGASRHMLEPERFFEEAHHRPGIRDTGPANKFAAGTFKFDAAFDQLFQTNIEETMFEVNASAYLRIPFDVESGARFDSLRLSLYNDDGFVAYLNGVEVARSNGPLELAYNSAATALRSDTDALEPTVIDLTEMLDLLNPGGANLLAIQAMNSSAGDPDFALSAQLDAITLLPPEQVYFDVPTPGMPNGEGLLGLVEDTKFSQDRTFVEAEDLDEDGQFLVEISTATEGAEIYYTTDGSLPSPAGGQLVTGAINIRSTTTLRAAAFKDRYLSTNVDTQTYIFLDDVLAQAGIPAGLPSQFNGVTPDYGISQDPEDLALIAGDANLSVSEAREVIKESLRSLPTMSIVMDVEDLFGPAEGLYSNPFPRGRDSERPASVEYILPDGSEGFQIDAGLRMMGWTSRIPSVSPKHSLRLVFRDEYGPSRLEYPLFADSPITSFDTLALRANSRDSWISDYPFGPGQGFPWPDFDRGAARPTATYLRDQWSKTLLGDLGQPTVRGNFVHLYLNGVYWGVYNPTERPDQAYAEEVFGGDEDDYDVVSFCNPTARNIHGSLEVWNELINLADQGFADNASYQRILGNNPDGTPSDEFETLIDIENFTDYIIAGQFDAADDWPCNYYAIRERGPDSEGFKFITWDNDLALPLGEVSASRLDIDLNTAFRSSPARIELPLRANPDYLLQYADRVQKHFFNDGALTPEANAQRWRELVEQVKPGLIAESARWGDYRRDVDPAGPAELYTVAGHFEPFSQRMLDEFFPQRSDVFLDELRSRGLFPTVAAPIYNQHGGDVPAGFDLSISPLEDPVYFTTDGSDPRVEGSSQFFVTENSEKRVLIPSLANGGSALDVTWTGGDEPFNDSRWRSGTGGVGYDANPDFDPLIGIDVLGEMGGIATSAFIRIPFTVDAADFGNIEALTLKMRYDDGFVAYLNGTEVARANAPAALTWQSAATTIHLDTLAVQYQDFNISSFASALVEGENILAIQGLNVSTTSSDFLISARLDGSNGLISSTATEYTGPISLNESTTVKARVLSGGVWSPLAEALFVVEAPLRVSEVMYNPAGSDEAEFIELVNLSGTETIDLTGVSLVKDANLGGIDYEFLPGDRNLSLAPGGRIVVVRDREAFAAAYPYVPDEAIADRTFDGRLSNGGEAITLLDAAGGQIQQFSYDDAWQTATDGEGNSLVVVDPALDVELWNQPAAWRASFELGGSPGEEDRMTGDLNGDDRVGLGDLAILRRNLGSEDPSFSGGDLNRDGAIDRGDYFLMIGNLGREYTPPPLPLPPAQPLSNAASIETSDGQPVVGVVNAAENTTAAGTTTARRQEDFSVTRRAPGDPVSEQTTAAAGEPSLEKSPSGTPLVRARRQADAAREEVFAEDGDGWTDEV